MNSQLKPDIKVLNFRRIQPIQQGDFKRLHVDSVLMTVVLVQIGGTEQQKQKMKECEQWIKKNQLIRLMKINKIQAFQPTYRLLMKQSLPAYFITLIPIEKLTSQPIYNLYKSELKNGKSLSQVNQIAKVNISRIKFIIIQNQIQKLGKMSFLHSGVHLVTSQTIFIFDTIEQYLKSRGKLKIQQSSSSINTIQIETFAKQQGQIIGEGVLSPQKKVQPTFDPVKQAWKMKNNTPGVGSYNVSK